MIIAEDGIQAAELAFEKHPDLIISDIEMPKMDGYQVCRLLKNDPSTANTPIILLTSLESSGSVFWGYQTGADLYLIKDFKPEELFTALEDLFFKYDIQNKKTKKTVAEKVGAFQVMGKLNKYMDKRLFEITLINEINQVAVNLTSISDTLISLLTILDKAIENHIIGFAIFTEENEIVLSIKKNKNVSKRTMELFQYHILEGLSFQVSKDIADFKIEVEISESGDISNYNNIPEPEFDISLMYSIPIRAKEENFGILNVYHPEMSKITVFPKQLLEKLRSYISTTISATAMYSKIKTLSVLDGLTGLYNRRYIMELFKIEFNKTGRYNTALSIVMIDIDDFKKINDSYGHLSGDMVLKSLSNIIKSNLRNFDLPGRYGGEEFILILPETSKDKGKIVAERIRKQVEDYTFKTISGEAISITISLGISGLGDLTEIKSEMELIKIADSRLYQAKKEGKNKAIHE